MAFSVAPLWSATNLLVALSSLAIFFVLLRLTYPINNPMTPRRAIPSPRETLIPFLSRSQATALPYPPNFLPGSRDVDTPYGIMRVYEWGPDEGRKVVMVHGDTTPGPMLGPIAKALVQRGCRVMILDLWGRGYSDSPLDVPHDARLFSMQILFAAASSPLSWTGATSGGFSVIAFSLGCGVAMSFASHFPFLVNAIILLAPGGLLRRMPDGYDNLFFRYPSLVPLAYLRRLVGKILGVTLSGVPINQTLPETNVPAAPGVPPSSETTENQDLDIPAIVQWQFDNHRGFVHSFVNTINHGPLMHQHSEWSNICKIIRGESSNAPASSLSSQVHNSKILVLLGEADGIVLVNEVSEDLKQILGPEHVEFRTIPGGHGFPVPHSEDVIEEISKFWKLQVAD